MVDWQGVSKDFAKNERKAVRLLLVEDDETDVLFVQRCLAKHDAAVSLTVARDGSEALAILRDGSVAGVPYVVLTDLNMPGMSGHELIEEIRSDPTLAHNVIFVLSSSRLMGDIRRTYSHNVAGYLTKQEAPAEQKRQVNMILDYCTTVHLLA